MSLHRLSVKQLLTIVLSVKQFWAGTPYFNNNISISNNNNNNNITNYSLEQLTSCMDRARVPGSSYPVTGSAQ